MEKAFKFENKAYVPSQIEEIFNCAKCDLSNKKPRYCRVLRNGKFCPVKSRVHKVMKELKGGL